MAAGVFAVIAGLLGLMMMSLGFVGILLGGAQLPSAQFPPALRNIALAVMVFSLCLSAFGVATGIGVFLLRKWARISLLIWGGCCVFFGILGGAFALFMPLAEAPGMPEMPSGALQEFRWVMACIYGLPALIGAWWLFLFNRKTVKAQFNGEAVGLAAQKPRPPLLIAILAWLYITTAAHIVILPFLPFSMPLFLFGHFFSGPAATASYLLLCLVFTLVGFGLLKLNPWSYSATIGLQMFFLASAIFTVLSPNYAPQMQSLYEQIQSSMHLPANPAYAPDFAHSGWSVYVGISISVAVLGILLYYRRRFLDAAGRAAQTAVSPPPNPLA
jgi:hypothetical protein